MQALRTFDYLTTARTRLFEWVRPLSADQYLREFPIGLGTIGRTLTHIMICEYAYAERICGRSLPPYDQWPIQDEHPPTFAVLEAAWKDQARATREALSGVRDWSKEFEYRISPEVSNVERPMIVTATYGDVATQMALHEVHHRAQVLFMLRQLGIPGMAPQDLDYNTLMYKRRPA